MILGTSSKINVWKNQCFGICLAFCTITSHAQNLPNLKESSVTSWKEADYAGSGAVTFNNDELEILMGEQLSGVAWKDNLPGRIDYQIEFMAMKIDGSDFFCGLTFPYKDDACSLILGGWGGGVVGISSINGQDASDNETTDYMKFEDDRWYEIKVRATQDKIVAFLDNRKIVDLNTKDRQIDIRFGVEEFLPLGIATYQTSAKFKNLKWTTLGQPAVKDLANGFHYIETESYSEKDDQEVLKAFSKLRVADVSDALDRFGLGNIMVMDSDIHPLWKDTKTFEHQLRGIAITAKYIPSQAGIPHFHGTQEFDSWVEETYKNQTPEPFIPLFKKGSVLVIEEAGNRDTGSIGSNNIMKWALKGCAGVITSNTARDTDEIAAQKIPLYYKKPGRGIRPGRNQLESVNMPIVCGGVQVRPGDVVIADGDGVVVVPRKIALKVADYASGVLEGDKSSRAQSYKDLGIPADLSVK